MLFESPHHFEHWALPRAGGRAVPVSYVDLTALLDDGSRVDLRKCDVEGLELELRCDTSRCLDLLRGTGFGPPQVLREAHGCSDVLVTRPEHAS